MGRMGKLKNKVKNVATDVVNSGIHLGRNLATLGKNPITYLALFLLLNVKCKKDSVVKNTVTYTLSGNDFDRFAPALGYGETLAAARQSSDASDVGRVIIHLNGDFEQIPGAHINATEVTQFADTLQAYLFDYSDKFDGDQSVFNPIWSSTANTQRFENWNYSVQPGDDCERHWQTYSNMTGEKEVYEDSCMNYFHPACMTITDYHDLYQGYRDNYGVLGAVDRTYEDLYPNIGNYTAQEQKAIMGAGRTAGKTISYTDAMMEFLGQHYLCFPR